MGASAHTRLAVYASLAPGATNHHVLAPIKDQSWHRATLRARIIPDAAYGQYPGAVLDPAGDPVPVHILESPDLPNHWPRLDAFEGPAYRRAVVHVTLADPHRIIEASIYLLAGAPT